jgi:hypothetical protein
MWGEGACYVGRGRGMGREGACYEGKEAACYEGKEAVDWGGAS